MPGEDIVLGSCNVSPLSSPPKQYDGPDSTECSEGLSTMNMCTTTKIDQSTGNLCRSALQQQTISLKVENVVENDLHLEPNLAVQSSSPICGDANLVTDDAPDDHYAEIHVVNDSDKTIEINIDVKTETDSLITSGMCGDGLVSKVSASYFGGVGAASEDVNIGQHISTLVKEEQEVTGTPQTYYVPSVSLYVKEEQCGTFSESCDTNARGSSVAMNVGSEIPQSQKNADAIQTFQLSTKEWSNVNDFSQDPRPFNNSEMSIQNQRNVNVSHPGCLHVKEESAIRHEGSAFNSKMNQNQISINGLQTEYMSVKEESGLDLHNHLSQSNIDICTSLNSALKVPENQMTPNLCATPMLLESSLIKSEPSIERCADVVDTEVTRSSRSPNLTLDGDGDEGRSHQKDSENKTFNLVSSIHVPLEGQTPDLTLVKDEPDPIDILRDINQMLTTLVQDNPIPRVDGVCVEQSVLRSLEQSPYPNSVKNEPGFVIPIDSSHNDSLSSSCTGVSSVADKGNLDSWYAGSNEILPESVEMKSGSLSDNQVDVETRTVQGTADFPNVSIIDLSESDMNLTEDTCVDDEDTETEIPTQLNEMQHNSLPLKVDCNENVQKEEIKTGDISVKSEPVDDYDADTDEYECDMDKFDVKGFSAMNQGDPSYGDENSDVKPSDISEDNGSSSDENSDWRPSGEDDVDDKKLLRRRIVKLKCGLRKRKFECKWEGLKWSLKSIVKINASVKKEFPCPYCPKTFAYKSNMQLHCNTHTGAKPYKCPECEKAFADPSALLRHKRIHTGEKPYSCDICGKHFAQSAGVVSHRRTHSVEKPFECTECSKRFASKESLQGHKMIHTGALPYSCHECGAQFRATASLTFHIRMYHTGERPYACQQCPKRFFENTKLKIHMRSHTGERPYGCDICGKRYTQRGNLYKHVRKHTGERPFRCEECGKSFSEKVVLQRHMNTHSSDRPFPCNDCGGRFKSMAFLRAHAKIHEDKRHACPKCNREFVERSNLAKHIKVKHEKSKPFKCDECPKKYALQSTLKLHSLVHSREENYHCTFCTKSFYTKSHHRSHILHHVKPFKCEVCQKQFGDARSLRKHRESKHTI